MNPKIQAAFDRAWEIRRAHDRCKRCFWTDLANRIAEGAHAAQLAERALERTMAIESEIYSRCDERVVAIANGTQTEVRA